MKRARWLTLTLTLTLPLIAAVLLAGCNWRQQAAQVVKSAATPLASPSPTATPLPPPPTPTPDLRPRHIVQPGDTAWAIAARYGLTIAQLSAANRLFDASALAVGAELVIPITPTPTATPTPDPAATPTPTATADPAAAPSSTLPPPPATPTATPTPTPDLRVLYTVQSGDSLWAIAARFGITIAELIAANALGDESAILSIDQVLLIPLTPTPTATPSFRTATPTPTLTPIPTATPTPVPFTPPAMRSPADLADWPRYLADLINERRFAHGLPPLIWSPLLAEIAQAHAADCLARETLRPHRRRWRRPWANACNGGATPPVGRVKTGSTPAIPSWRWNGGTTSRPAPTPTAATCSLPTTPRSASAPPATSGAWSISSPISPDLPLNNRPPPHILIRSQPC